MARLSQQALTDALSAASQAGGDRERDAEALEEALLATRNRVRGVPTGDTLPEQRAAMIRILAPLMSWVTSEPDLAALPLEVKSDLLWNLYAACMSRTRNADALPLVTGNLETWHDVVATLCRAPPADAGPIVVTQQPHGMLHWYLALMGLLLLAVDPWIPSGRWRFYSTTGGTMLFGLSLVCWYFGWTSLGGRPRVVSTGGTNAADRSFMASMDTTRYPTMTLGTAAPEPENQPHSGPSHLVEPPPGAPAIPSASQQLGDARAASSSGGSVATGSRVVMLGIPPYQALAAGGAVEQKLRENV